MATKKTPSKKTPAKKTASVPAKAIKDNISEIGSVQLTMTAELGRTRDTIEKVMEYGDQSLIELDKNVGDPVDILLNGELFARGEVVTVSENFGVRVTEIIKKPGA